MIPVPMKLIIFDIDGTLTETSRVDEMCYLKTWAEVHGIEDIREHWDGCPHVSDAGVTEHVFQRLWGRDPSEAETEALKSVLVRMLQAHHEEDLSHFNEIPGAADTFNHHVDQSDWVKALATGCWRPSAEMKLRAAGIRYEGVPGGFSEDGAARERIVRAAIRRAGEAYERTSFDRVVSVGDGPWDVRTAANLGLPFLGIGAGERADRLRAAGAKYIIEHYVNIDEFFELLERAEIPVP